MTLFIENAHLFLPIIWVVVSTVVALLLYQTSKGVLQADQVLGIPVKNVRLAGSVVIFCVVFLLMRQSTSIETNAISVRRSDVEALNTTVTELERASVRLNTCAAAGMLDTTDCAEAAELLRDKTAQLRNKIEPIVRK